MKEKIFVAGHEGFNKEVMNRFSRSSYEFIAQNLNTQKKQTTSDLQELSKPITRAAVVFISSEPNLFPVAEMALKNAKHVVLFGVQKCSHRQLEQLLKLALESKSMLVNGDSLLFNPIIFPHRHQFLSTEMTTLHSNRFGRYISRRSIFNCVELLLHSNPSPVRTTSAKVVSLHDQMNLLHTRIEFENGGLCVLEMTNCKPQTTLTVETSGTGTWLSLDLLSFNGKKHRFNRSAELKSPEHIYAKERNSMMNLMDFVHNELPLQINPHQQFHNSIHTSEVILKMEEQLRREVPKFVHFNES